MTRQDVYWWRSVDGISQTGWRSLWPADQDKKAATARVRAGLCKQRCAKRVKQNRRSRTIRLRPACGKGTRSARDRGWAWLRQRNIAKSRAGFPRRANRERRHSPAPRATRGTPDPFLELISLSCDEHGLLPRPAGTTCPGRSLLANPNPLRPTRGEQRLAELRLRARRRRRWSRRRPHRRDAPAFAARRERARQLRV